MKQISGNRKSASFLNKKYFLHKIYTIQIAILTFGRYDTKWDTYWVLYEEENMSKRYFISTSRIVLSIAAAGIVGLAATPQAEAAEVTAVAESPATNATNTESTSSEVVAEEAPATEEASAVEESVASETAESSAITETTEEVTTEPVVEESTLVDPVVEDVITEDLTVSEVAVETPVTAAASDADT